MPVGNLTSRSPLPSNITDVATGVFRRGSWELLATANASSYALGILTRLSGS